MADTPMIRTVAMAHMLSERSFDQLALGVLQYSEHAEHWRFAGQPYWPFVRIKEIDPEKIDGVIGNFHEQEWVDAVQNLGIAVVNTSNRFADWSIPRVGHDEQAIGRLGAEHLLGKGFSQFGYVGRKDVWFAQMRHEGFSEALGRLGRTCHLLDDVDYNRKDNIAVIARWLEGLPKPIGILAEVDFFGAQVIDAATRLQLRIPEDVAVLGLGNDWRTTAMTHPPMSSIEVDARQVGYKAAKMLDELMAGIAPAWPQWVPPIGVAARKSTDVTLTDDPMVVNAMQYIRDHCTGELKVENVLESLGVSRRTLENRMKSAIGCTPQTAIHRAQIEYAKKLLTRSQDNLGQIARACGFDRQDQFCTVFKRLTGLTPGHYRQQKASGNAR